MRLQVKRPDKEEIISSIIAILLPIGLIMASTLYLVARVGKENNITSIKNRISLSAGYAALLVENTPNQKDLATLIRDYRNSIGVSKIAVIIEESKGELAFLKKRRYLVYPDSPNENAILSTSSPEDKRIFDLISQIQDNKSEASVIEDNKIYFVKRVEKSTQPLYIYLSENLYSSSDIPIPVLNSLLAALLSVFIFGVGFFFFYNFRHAFGLIAIVAFVLYSLSGKELIKRWNASLIKDNIIETSLTLDFNKEKRLKISNDEILRISPLKSISKVAPSEFIRKDIPSLTDQIIKTYRQQDAKYSYFLPVTMSPYEAIRMNNPIKGVVENHIGKYYLTLLFTTIFGFLIYILYAIGYVEIFVFNLIKYSYAYRYISPAVISTIILIFIPFVAGIALSFFEHDHGKYTFVGFDNYIKILTSEGRRLLEPLSFYYTFLVTILWTATNLIIHVSVGLFLALILKNPLLKLKEVYRVILILPWAIPNYITALIWKGMFHKQFGVINQLVGYFGIEEISWFSSFSTAFTANLIANSWLGFPFMMVISLGALQSIPNDIYEAADIEGASKWQKFRKITLPLLKPALFPAIILGSIWTFNMFNIIYLVSGGEPSGATDILIVEAYRWAFERGERYGYAAAYSTIIFLILLGYSLVTNKYSKATENIYR